MREDNVDDYQTPEEIEAAEAAALEEAKKSDIIEKLGLAIAKKRSDAMKSRQNSGIEEQWRRDEEYYEGIDELNRGDILNAWESKPAGQADVDDDGEEAYNGSTVFVNITRPFVDAAAARAGDMLQPTDDRAWVLSATPVPELAPLADGNIPSALGTQIDQQFPDNPEQQEAKRNELVEEAKKILQQARDKAEKATERIDDWHVQCQYTREIRRVIHDSAKVGAGVLKGPVPGITRQVALSEGQLVINESIDPKSKRVDYWNLFPDGGCGENIHNGSFILERDDITDKELRAFLDLPEDQGYLVKEIQTVIEEGPKRASSTWNTDEGRPESANLNGLQERDRSNLFEIWYFYGQINESELEACGCEEYKKSDGEGDPSVMYDVVVTMINNHVIQVAPNTLDTGEFPYDIMVWQTRRGMPWGMGIASQIRTAQRIVNANTRAMMDNAGRASGPQIVVQSGVVVPADGDYTIHPWKVWQAAEGADEKGLENAFRFVKVDMYQDELQSIVEFGMRIAEDATGFPMIMQGQTSAATPDTVGGMQLQNENASTVLRRIARLFDDLITEPHIRRYYAYLLQYGDDEEKGDFQVDARGSTALVEREIQSNFLLQLGNFVTNPIFKKDPARWFDIYLKSKRLSPDDMEYEDDEWQEIVEKLSQPPTDPRVEVEKMRGEFKLQLQDMMNEFKGAAQINAQEHEKEMQNNELEADLLLQSMEQDIASFSKGVDKRMSDDDRKAKIAEFTAKLRTQMLLSMNKVPGEVIKPASEPAGRAPNGHSFQA